VEQFVIDVAGVDDRLRRQLGSALGADELLEFVVALFALDYGQRVALVLGALFPDDPVVGSGPHGPAPAAGSVDGAALLATFDELSRAVARLDALDPVTTELVRLRGARHHDCRLCRSTRSARALDAGADEDVLDATERYEASDLAQSQKVALRLTDAVLTRPAGVDRVLAGQVHEWFAPTQVVELVMDVMRNSGQKVAVALAADDPHVTEGVERFEIARSGDVVYLP
jgi:alkylhydroperoxidase family enzyme